MSRLPSRSRDIRDEGDCLNTVREQYVLLDKIRNELTQHHTRLLAAEARTGEQAYTISIVGRIVDDYQSLPLDRLIAIRSTLGMDTAIAAEHTESDIAAIASRVAALRDECNVIIDRRKV